MHDALQAWALSRGHVFTTAHASRLGVCDHELRQMCGAGEVARARRTAYVLGDAWQAADEPGRLALRTRAVLAGRPGGWATHQSALALHGLPLWGVDFETVDVAGAVARVRTRPGLRVHPQRGFGEIVVADGYRCTTIADAVARVTVRSGVPVGLVPLDAVLHARRCSLDEVAIALAGIASGRTAVARSEALLARADAACESVGETRTRTLLDDLGFPARSQVPVHDEDGHLVARVDFLVGGRVVVEFDGLVTYGGAAGAEALVAEKRREDALRALGYVVVRLTWADLDSPGRVAAMIRRGLAQPSSAGAPPAAP